MRMEVLQECVANLFHLRSDEHRRAQKTLGSELRLVHHVPKQDIWVVLESVDHGVDIFLELGIPLHPQSSVSGGRLPVLPQQRHEGSLSANGNERVGPETPHIIFEERSHKGFLLWSKSRTALKLIVGIARRHPFRISSRTNPTGIK